MKLLTVFLAGLLLAVPLFALEADGSVRTCTPNAACAANCEKSLQPLCDSFEPFQACLKFYGMSDWGTRRACKAVGVGGGCLLAQSMVDDSLRACKNGCSSTCVVTGGSASAKPLPTVQGPSGNSACYRTCGQSIDWHVEGGVAKPVSFQGSITQTVALSDLTHDCTGLLFKSWSGSSFVTPATQFTGGSVYLVSSGNSCTISYKVKC